MKTVILVKNSLRSMESDLSQFIEKKAKKNAKKILETLGLQEFELSLSFVGERSIKTMNKHFRGKDKSTDVLSFPMQIFENMPSIQKPWSGKTYAYALGDVVVCPKIAKKQAQALGHSLEREMIFLMIHGILHLCGYDHENDQDERIMLKQQKKMLAILKQEF